MGQRLIQILNKLVNAVLVVSAAILFALSAYSLVDNHRIYENANDKSLLLYRPQLGITSEQVNYISDKQVGWLQVFDTKIDYPLMQGESNFEFLSSDPYGEYRMSGSIFLDYRNESNLMDEYSVIYGHHMDRDSMFGTLDSFMEQHYFENHRRGRIVCREESYDLELFAVATGESTNWTLFDPMDRTTEEILEYIQEYATIYDEYIPGSRIVALTTCWGEGAMKRLLVFGMLNTQGEGGIR